MKNLWARSFLLCTALAALCLLLFQSFEKPAAAAVKHPACEMCHLTATPIEGPSLFPAGVDPSSICLRCHDYRENHHPVFFTPIAPRQATPGKDFPLYNGEVRCLTCHDPHGGPRFSEPPKLLRGGPYTDRREICFKCHFREKYAEVNPHIMKDSAGNLMTYFDKPVCLLCHSVMPDPAVDRTKDVKFRADVGFLCWRCHPPMPGEFFTYHFLMKPSKTTLRDVRKAEKELGVILPLIPRGRITCSTCHNPHQKDVIIHEPARSGADSPMKLRLKPSAMCIACHSTK